MKRAVFAFVLTALLLFMPLAFSAAELSLIPDPRASGSKVELHIGDDGKTSVQGMQVTKVAGSVIFGRVAWGTVFIRWTVITNAATRFSKRFGTAAGLSDIGVGDYISMEGDFYGSSDSLSMTARSVKDWSLHEDESRFSGTVASVEAGARSFILAIHGSNPVTVRIATGTAVTRGVIGVSPENIAAGDRITSVEGTFDYLSKTIVASDVRIYQDKSIFRPRNFQGKLVSIGSVELPATLVVAVGGKNYTVYLPMGALVLRANKAPGTLKRFLAGDTVRFFGAVRETDLSAVDAEIIRNLNL